ncbi:hypothetical protein AB0J83_01415 [Actinoplanes sp. NPDC049596]|uniref:hypothetical protein n=1 Tax=unclassified Actinoplanes TaxID=2626549 RepID=UPI00343A23C0
MGRDAVTKKIYVTKTQVKAAQLLVERSKATGKTVRSSIAKIAGASGRSSAANSAKTRKG